MVELEISSEIMKLFIVEGVIMLLINSKLQNIPNVTSFLSLYLEREYMRSLGNVYSSLVKCKTKATR